MNRTKIEWTDLTWNPVTGCWGPGGSAVNPAWCPYCYARRMALRFGVGLPGGKFVPHIFPNLLDEPARRKKPAKIFVCSMGDLFGDWVPREWIQDVFLKAWGNPHHTFIFLTKNPSRYQEFNPWPSNCWLGTTITNQADADARVPELLKAQAPVRFVSAEPLLGEIDFIHPYRQYLTRGLNWIIIGAMTGPGAVQPDPGWVVSLERQAQNAGVPLFEKNNLLPILRKAGLAEGVPLIQEWPK